MNTLERYTSPSRYLSATYFRLRGGSVIKLFSIVSVVHNQLLDRVHVTVSWQCAIGFVGAS